MQEVFIVENIKCNGCAGTIQNALHKMNPDFIIAVQPEKGMVSVESEQPINRNTVLAKLQSLGYPEESENTLFRKAKSYVSCAIGKMQTENN